MNVRDREGRASDDMVVAALHRLAPHLDGEPDPAFRATTRARLVAVAAVRSPAPEPVTGFRRLLAARADDAAPGRWRSRLTAGLAAAALTVTAGASLVALSSGARPGDVLYGLKRGTEETQLALAGDSRGQTLLDFASTRLRELETMVEDPGALPATGAADGTGGTVLAAGADPELVISTLETMDDQTTEGAAWLAQQAVTTRSDAPLDHLAVWASRQTDELTALAPQLPDAAGAAVSRSLTLLNDVSARTDGLQLALTCAAGPSVGASDALGPTPAQCVPGAPAAPSDGATPGVPGGPTTQPTTPAAPTTPPGTGAVPGTPGSGGTSSGGGSSGLPVPGTPTTPGRLPIPVPSIPGVPGLPPLSGTGTPDPGGDTSGPLGDVTDGLGDVLCRPVGLLLGDC